MTFYELADGDLCAEPTTSTNISALPNELIRLIFTFLTEFSTNAPRDHIDATIAASQVCSTWRKISLSTPSIWARCLDYGLSDDCVATILARSRNEPLDIVIPSFIPAFQERSRTHILVEEMYGFNSEVVWMDHLDISDFCERRHYPGNPLPADITVFQRCDTLQLIVQEEFCRWDDCYPALKDWLPSMRTIALMHEHERFLPAPLLMEAAEVGQECSWNVDALHLRNCTIPLQVPVFQSLTKLTVGNMDPMGYLFTPSGWLQVLENMPGLRILSLKHALTSVALLPFEDVRREQSPVAEFVPLALIEFIELETTLPLAQQLLNRLRVPLNCSVKLDLYLLHEDIEVSFNALCREIEERYGTYDPTLCNCVMFSFTGTMCRIIVGTHWVDAQFGKTLIDVTINYSPGPRARTLDFRPSEPLIKVLTALGNICKEVPSVIVGRIGIFAFRGKFIYCLFQKAVFLVFEGWSSNLGTALVTFLNPKRKNHKVLNNVPESTTLSPLPSLNVVVLLGRCPTEHIVNLRNFKKGKLTIHKLYQYFY